MTMAVFGGSSSSLVVGGRRRRDQQSFGGHGAPGFILLALTCLLVCVLKVDAGASHGYRGVSPHKNSRFFHCETEYFGSSPRKKIYFGRFDNERMAALACDVAFFYTGMPSAKFNFRWSEEAISLVCKHRAHYAILDNWDDRRGFIVAQATAFMSLVPEFHWEDVVLEDGPPVPTLRDRSEWIARQILHHFRNQPRRVPEFMAWFMEPATERRILEVHAQKFPSATYDGLVLSAPEVDDLIHVHMNMDDIVRRVGSLEDRPGRNLWLLLFFGSALPFIFKLFESKRAAGGDNDRGVNDRRGTAVRSQRIRKKQKASHRQHDVHTDGKARLTAFNYHLKNKEWYCTGYDLNLKTWRTLPQISPTLPAPEYTENLKFCKEYIICGHGELMCADVSKCRGKASLVVFNPVTMETSELPPLLHPRSPVLVHMVHNESESMSFKVIVAGSATSGDEHLSKKIEVFDSTTSKWEEAPELPGPPYGLNEWQTGACVDGVLYFIAFLEGDGGKGVVAFDVENRTWLRNRTCPFRQSGGSDISQLVESDGEVCLFQEIRGDKLSPPQHCIDVLEISTTEEKCQWTEVLTVPIKDRGLAIYPEYTCVSFGDGKLCVFNTIKRNGVVYDMQDGSQCDELEPPPSDQEDKLQFFSKNPASFLLQLRY